MVLAVNIDIDFWCRIGNMQARILACITTHQSSNMYVLPATPQISLLAMLVADSSRYA